MIVFQIINIYFQNYHSFLSTSKKGKLMSIEAKTWDSWWWKFIGMRNLVLYLMQENKYILFDRLKEMGGICNKDTRAADIESTGGFEQSPKKKQESRLEELEK